jgi:hypothetical protein
MLYLFYLFLFLGNAFSHEKEMRTKADFLATGTFNIRKYHPWPFSPLSIGHNMQSFQDYGGQPYWHDGLDLRSQVYQPIYSATSGKVVNLQNYIRGNPLYWEIAILDEEGFVWKYHHVDRESMPDEIFKAYKEGLQIDSGTLLGHVVQWPVTTFGEAYHHLHLLVVAKDGKYINPFMMMNPLEDTSRPIIKKIGLAKKHIPTEDQEVSGPHSLYLEASDLTLHDKFILPPHRISYRLDNSPEILVWEFSTLPSGDNDKDYIEDFYMKGTCGNYLCRKFYFNLNFTLANPRQEMILKPGKHFVEVMVEDISGNKMSSVFEWKVIQHFQ